MPSFDWSYISVMFWKAFGRDRERAPKIYRLINYYEPACAFASGIKSTNKMSMKGVVVTITLLQLTLSFLCDGQVAIRARQCTVFGRGRIPKEAYSLSNCTWFKERSCCRHTEVTSVFQAMMPLETNNQKCYNLMNYLMCYFCSPEQEQWYKASKVHVCQSFCTQIYDNCKSASYKGVTIGKEYTSGKKFCEAQLFVVEESKENCFDYNLPSSSFRCLPEYGLPLFLTLIAFYLIRFSLVY